jgi:dihydroxyacid dehydratase/phosphogluconate dehydratase
MRHRATSRYSNGRKHRGKVVSKREVARRIAQSYGWNVNNSTIMTKEAIDNAATLSL